MANFESVTTDIKILYMYLYSINERGNVHDQSTVEEKMKMADDISSAINALNVLSADVETLLHNKLK